MAARRHLRSVAPVAPVDPRVVEHCLVQIRQKASFLTVVLESDADLSHPFDQAELAEFVDEIYALADRALGGEARADGA